MAQFTVLFDCLCVSKFPFFPDTYLYESFLCSERYYDVIFGEIIETKNQPLPWHCSKIYIYAVRGGGGVVYSTEQHSKSLHS